MSECLRGIFITPQDFYRPSRLRVRGSQALPYPILEPDGDEGTRRITDTVGYYERNS
jgi:hypothetical protein